VRLLSRSGYGGQIVLFNGTNGDPESKATYNGEGHNLGGDQITGSPTGHAPALVDRFRNDAKIMIATEAAAEGHQPAVLFDGREL